VYVNKFSPKINRKTYFGKIIMSMRSGKKCKQHVLTMISFEEIKPGRLGQNAPQKTL